MAPRKSQTQTIITDPACFNGTSLSDISGGVRFLRLGHDGAARDLLDLAHLPLALHGANRRQPGAPIDQGLHAHIHLHALLRIPPIGGARLERLSARRLHLQPRRRAHHPRAAAQNPNTARASCDQYFPEAVFNENQLIVNLNARFTPKLSLMGFYNASWANSDGGGGSNPSNSYNLRQDYGRASFVRPQWLFLMGNYTGPWAITFNPFLVAQAGSPVQHHLALRSDGRQLLQRPARIRRLRPCLPATSSRPVLAPSMWSRRPGRVSFRFRWATARRQLP